MHQTKTKKRAKNLSIACLLDLGQYSTAITEYDTLINNASSFIDSLYAEADKALAELKLSGNMLAKTAGNSISPQLFENKLNN